MNELLSGESFKTQHNTKQSKISQANSKQTNN